MAIQPFTMPVALAWGASSSALTGVAANEPSIGPDLQQQLQALLAQKDVYMSLGDDISLDISKRGTAYEEGARFARQAIDLQDQNAGPLPLIQIMLRHYT